LIPIDVSQVPAEKLSHPSFPGLRAEMEHALTQQKWISAFCIHETGHIIYLTELGVTEFSYSGPTIVYDTQKDDFDGFIAAVTPSMTNIPENSDPYRRIATFAKAQAAGRTFARRLTGASDAVSSVSYRFVKQLGW
jgi:hypothetical protein